MSNAIVRVKLESALAAYAAANNLPVAWEDRPFTPPNNGSYLEAFFIPNNTYDVTVDGTRQRYLGLFQINIYTRSGHGSNISETIEHQLIDLFPFVPKNYLPVSIEGTPSSVKLYQEVSGFSCRAVTVRYRYESSTA